MAERKKHSKKEAEYGEARSSNKRCGVCKHMRQPDMCTMVEGDIGADMVCQKFFEHKATPYKD
jgi:hypothetical protein